MSSSADAFVAAYGLEGLNFDVSVAVPSDKLPKTSSVDI